MFPFFFKALVFWEVFFFLGRGEDKDLCVPFYDNIGFCLYFLENALTVLSAVNFSKELHLRFGRVPRFAFVSENDVLGY